MSYREIQYLLFLYEYQNKNEKHEKNHFKDFGRLFGERFDLGNYEYFDVFQKLVRTGFVEVFYTANKPTITQNRVRNEYDEEFTMSDFDIEVDYFMVTETFIDFAEIIGERYE